MVEARNDKLNQMVMSSIEDFLEQANSHRMYRAWVDTDIIRVYMRKSFRPLGGNLKQCLDVGSISIQEEYRGKGLCSFFLSKTHAFNPYDATYIESILNPIIEQWCIRRAWILVAHASPPSYYKLTTY